MIKTFEEWYEESKIEFSTPGIEDELKSAYESALQISKDHFEEEKILIHSYYDMRLKELFGNKEVLIQPTENNGGKLT